MGAWIEISFIVNGVFKELGRTPRWVRGLKYFINSVVNKTALVAPHDGCVDWNSSTSLNALLYLYVAPHDGCVDWNSVKIECIAVVWLSHPTMGAWIEIR